MEASSELLRKSTNFWVRGLTTFRNWNIAPDEL